ncbi:MAG: hypothetical protein ABI165_06780, partial [Bryobacteraceae bacterium]
ANVFNDGLGASVNSDRMNHGRQMLFGQAPARPDIPCTTCELFHTLRDTGRWLTQREIDAVLQPSGVLLSIVPVIENPEVRRVRVFAMPGRNPRPSAPTLVEQNPAMYHADKEFSILAQLPQPGPYTICALPEGRREPVTVVLEVSALPICQEVRIPIR